MHRGGSGWCPLHKLPLQKGDCRKNPFLPLHPTFTVAWLQYSLTVCLHPPSAGTKSYGILNGFNKTVLRTLPRSRNLIVVESVLMAVAFLAMLLVRGGGGSKRFFPCKPCMWAGRGCRPGA